ncbi:MAG: transpeptidase family protein [Ignavibacteriaceae bacterium]|nr:transpeptidase family protein [Ignavibacteriaceae bacterium]NUM69534.1 transpeptidase family protein [Ignavibacteriaceae bacterium]
MSFGRMMTVSVALLIFFIFLVVRLINIHVVKAEEYSFFAKRQQYGTEEIPTQRGSIFDRNNTLLVFNQRDVSFFVDTRLAIKYKKDSVIARVFEKNLGKDFDYYLNLIRSGKKFISLEKKVSSEKAAALRSLVIDGLVIKEDPTRIYQYQTLASNLLGFVNGEYEGAEGVELSANDDLKGMPGKKTFLRDAQGNMISLVEDATVYPSPGDNIVLTIDKEIQYALETELKKGVDESKADHAVGIVMDPNTGEVLAMASVPDYDPARPGDFDPDIRKNKAITDVYEPGSTFKGIAMATYLDRKVCSPDEVIYAENGRYKFNGVYISDSHGEGNITVEKVFAVSSNIGMSKLSERVNNEDFYKYTRSFGFGNITNVGLRGEVKGSLKMPSEWSKLTKSSMSYGYEVAVTPIQLIAAYAAIVNGGNLYQPYIIKEVVSPGGSLVRKNEPKLIRNPISPATSEIMRKFLLEAVENGTGKKGSLGFGLVGGKTGTSRKIVDGEYSKEKYNSSFIGAFPIEKPEYIILVVVHSPASKSYYGGDVAAPIFKGVAQRIIHIDEQFAEYRDKIKIRKDPETDTLRDKGILPDSIKVQFALEPRRISTQSVTPGKMPNLKGVSLREAIKVLNTIGVSYVVEGSGKIYSQSIPPGTKINGKAVCEIKAQESKLMGVNLY